MDEDTAGGRTTERARSSTNGQGGSAGMGLDSGRRLSTTWWRGAAPANDMVGEQRYDGSGGRTTSERVRGNESELE